MPSIRYGQLSHIQGGGVCVKPCLEAFAVPTMPARRRVRGLGPLRLRARRRMRQFPICGPARQNQTVGSIYLDCLLYLMGGICTATLAACSSFRCR